MFPTKSPELFSIYHTTRQNAAAKSSLRDILAMNSCHQHDSVSTLCIFSYFSLILLLKCVYPSHIHDFIHVLDFIFLCILYQWCLEILGDLNKNLNVHIKTTSELPHPTRSSKINYPFPQQHPFVANDNQTTKHLKPGTASLFPSVKKNTMYFKAVLAKAFLQGTNGHEPNYFFFTPYTFAIYIPGSHLE
mgnify:CR=1 FL=1